MASPYQGLGPEAFWRKAVAEADPAADPAFYRPRHPITPETRIFTAGSCFAQHVARALKAAGCHVIDTEPVTPGLPEQVTRAFGYGLYSARFGNIYTLRQFRQLVEEAAALHVPACPVWTRDGRFHDALRPAVEPEGLGSEAAVRAAREEHLEALRTALDQAELLVFTLGLTECWEHLATGTVYPTAPETLAGTFDPAVFGFRNLGYEENIDDFVALRGHLAEINPYLRVLLTVSPVPLTATASGDHVLTASVRSKAILRAVCAALVEADPAVDYFPSYELVTAPQPGGGHWFEPNLRSVSAGGVARVMACFLRAHGLSLPEAAAAEEPEDAVCEEVLLEAFAR